VFDLYRNIHKGIRAELFSVTGLAGRVDPGDRRARVELAARVGEVADLLVAHAGHEDAAIQPALEEHLPALAERISHDHERIEASIVSLRHWSAEAVEAEDSARRVAGHRCYIELASFTAAYLEHQDVEERLVMPALEDAIGVEAVIAINRQIVGSIPPPQLASTLALMLPAMNVDDRSELLAGLRGGAPAEVFAGIWGLAQTVLASSDVAALAARLDV
jgi:hypothetical protein